MRPTLLDPFFATINTLTGVGPKISTLIAKLLNYPAMQGDPRLIDILHFLPHSVIDRRERPGVAFAREGAISTLELTIDRHQPSPQGKRNVPYRVFAHDETGAITLVFFHAQKKWLEGQLPIGEKVIVSGKVEWFNGNATMVHPDHMATFENAHNLPLIEPIYHGTAGLSPKTFHKAILEALLRIPTLDEWHDSSIIKREAFPSYYQALNAVHNPSEPNDILPLSPARKRLAYDEFLAGQLALALVRQKTRRITGRVFPTHQPTAQNVRNILPFKLTQGQEKAIDEILQDLESPNRMLRLLQGDVGSGKTVVALAAMAQVAHNGAQSALMAPTEVLARQHYATIQPLAEKLGLKTSLLTGREKAKDRQVVLEDIMNGNTNIIIGTHALIQEGVIYHDLGFAIIDEQHRFGVQQRLELTAKGNMPDMLVMTATPIPRTLVLTAFGDMDVSKLTEKPIGRKPIKTAVLPIERINELITRIKAALEEGEKLYWICPLVEESEIMDLTATTERFEMLKSIFGNKVGLVHGKMTGAEKDIAMADFKQGKTRLLVATTVIEVGVDVSDASIIIIEHAERFGLAQLHQLRGRVGRGDKQSSCILLYKAPLSKMAEARLAIMRESEDGFRIAEEDLKLRGEGELLGTKQSGVPGFSLADMSIHEDLLLMARQDAKLILTRDPDLSSERGKALRNLLYLFKRDDAIRLLRAG